VKKKKKKNRIYKDVLCLYDAVDLPVEGKGGHRANKG
jgi:hypothetical protein